jgi:hypothetical protein
VLHDWTDARAQQILTRCAEAVPPHGVLVINELIMPERVEPSAPPRSPDERVIRQDLSMLVLMGGRERTEGEYRQILASAGFRLTQCLSTAAPSSLLVATPAQNA